MAAWAFRDSQVQVFSGFCSTYMLLGPQLSIECARRSLDRDNEMPIRTSVVPYINKMHRNFNLENNPAQRPITSLWKGGYRTT